MAQQQFRHGDDNRSAVGARGRARDRVRRITGLIGAVATAAAVGLGVLVASDTTAHSSVAARTPTTPTSTSAGSATGTLGSSGFSRASTVSGASTPTTTTPTTTVTAPASSSTGAATTSGQT